MFMVAWSTSTDDTSFKADAISNMAELEKSFSSVKSNMNFAVTLYTIYTKINPLFNENFSIETLDILFCH